MIWLVAWFARHSGGVDLAYLAWVARHRCVLKAGLRILAIGGGA